MPSDAVDVICLMPSSPWIASSIRTQTASSTSSGAAPRYGTSTLIKSSENSGKTSELMLANEMNPLVTRHTISKLAATEFRANHSIIRFITLVLETRRAIGRRSRW